MPSTHTGNMVTAVTPPIKMVITGGWFAFMALFYPHSKGYMHDINPFHSIPLESIFSKSISMLRPHTLVILPLFQLNQENPTWKYVMAAMIPRIPSLTYSEVTTYFIHIFHEVVKKLPINLLLPLGYTCGSYCLFFIVFQAFIQGNLERLTHIQQQETNDSKSLFCYNVFAQLSSNLFIL